MHGHFSFVLNIFIKTTLSNQNPKHASRFSCSVQLRIFDISKTQCWQSTEQSCPELKRNEKQQHELNKMRRKVECKRQTFEILEEEMERIKGKKENWFTIVVCLPLFLLSD